MFSPEGEELLEDDGAGQVYWALMDGQKSTVAVVAWNGTHYAVVGSITYDDSGRPVSVAGEISIGLYAGIAAQRFFRGRLSTVLAVRIGSFASSI